MTLVVNACVWVYLKNILLQNTLLQNTLHHIELFSIQINFNIQINGDFQWNQYKYCLPGSIRSKESVSPFKRIRFKPDSLTLNLDLICNIEHQCSMLMRQRQIENINTIANAKSLTRVYPQTSIPRYLFQGHIF